MKIIALAAAKGGVGKTTLAAALAVAAARAGAAVGLADLDPHGSLTRWWDARALPSPLHLKLAPERLPRVRAALRGVPLDFLVLDCPPGFSPILERAVVAADLMLVATGPDELDLAAVASTAEMAERAGTPFRFASIQRRRDCKASRAPSRWLRKPAAPALRRAFPPHRSCANRKP